MKDTDPVWIESGDPYVLLPRSRITATARRPSPTCPAASCRCGRLELGKGHQLHLAYRARLADRGSALLGSGDQANELTQLVQSLVLDRGSASKMPANWVVEPNRCSTRGWSSRGPAGTRMSGDEFAVAVEEIRAGRTGASQRSQVANDRLGGQHSPAPAALPTMSAEAIRTTLARP